jgi:hypothetical protein
VRQPPSDSHPHRWPTREEWAQNRRSLFRDSRFEVLDIRHELSAYAFPGEIEALIAALRALWKQKGAALRALQVPAGLRRQQGESDRAYYLRWKQIFPPNRSFFR